MENKKESNEGLGTFLRELVVMIGIALLIRFFVFNITAVDGTSMIPTLQDGDKLITSKISVILRKPKFGEIVVIKAPSHDGRNFIKRVIGLPGDRIEIKDQKVYRNGEQLSEEYTISQYTYPDMESSWQIEGDRIFVMGDNRLPGGSNDSRRFGSVPLKDVIGISMFRIWPFSRAGKL